MTRRQTLAALPLLALSSQPACLLVLLSFWGALWRWRFRYSLPTAAGIGGDLHIIDRDGSLREITSGIPFNIVQPRDAVAQIPRRGIAGPHGVFMLDVYAQDQILGFVQETGMYQGSFDVDMFPQGIALSADGARLYVTHLAIAPGGFFPPTPPHVSVYNTATRTLITTINLPADKLPRKPVLSPDGRKLYIPNAGTFVAPVGYSGASVLIVDTQTNAYIGEIPIGINLATVGQLVITPDGAMIYAASIQFIPARIFAIDVESGTVITLTAPSSIKHILINQTGSRLYVLSESRIVAYDTATLTEAGRLDFNPNPRLNVLALSFDGGTLFANHEFADAVTPIDTKTFTARPIIGSTAQTVDGSFALMVPLGPMAI